MSRLRLFVLGLLSGSRNHQIKQPQKRRKTVRKIIVALVISAALIVSGVSVTTFSTGQLTGSAWADGGE